jgi:hypothetical protein
MKATRTPTTQEVQELSRRNSYQLDFSEIHQSIEPADIRGHERILARLRKRGSEAPFQDIRIWRLSPLGVELIADSGFEDFQKGDSIDLEIVVSGQRTTFEGLVVDLVLSGDSSKVLGVRLSRKIGSSIPGIDRRGGERWICSDEFLPTSVAPTPVGLMTSCIFRCVTYLPRGYSLVVA